MNIHKKLTNLGFKKRKNIKNIDINYLGEVDVIPITIDSVPNSKCSFYTKKCGDNMMVFKVLNDIIDTLYYYDEGELKLKEVVEFTDLDHLLKYDKGNNRYHSPKYIERLYDSRKIVSEMSIIDSIPQEIKRDIILDRILGF